MKSYKVATIIAIKLILRDYLLKPGRVSTGAAMRIMHDHTFGLSSSSLRNIFCMIMTDMCLTGKAKKTYRGNWEILEEGAPSHEIPKYEKIDPSPVVVFDPKLNEWLNPPKPTPWVDVYNELRKLKGAEKSRFIEHAIILCDKAGVSINKLIEYINEKRSVGIVEAARA